MKPALQTDVRGGTLVRSRWPAVHQVEAALEEGLRLMAHRGDVWVVAGQVRQVPGVVYGVAIFEGDDVTLLTRGSVQKAAYAFVRIVGEDKATRSVDRARRTALAQAKENPVVPVWALAMGSAAFLGLAYLALRPNAAPPVSLPSPAPASPSVITVTPANAGQTVNVKAGDQVQLVMPVPETGTIWNVEFTGDWVNTGTWSAQQTATAVVHTITAKAGSGDLEVSATATGGTSTLPAAPPIVIHIVAS